MTFDAFTLKKVASLLVHLIPGVPLLMILALILLNWWPRFSKGCLWFCAVTLLLSSSSLVSNLLIESLEIRFPPLQTAANDTRLILALGSGHQFRRDQAPNSVLSAVSLSRVTEAIRLWKTNTDAILVTSGAQSDANTSTAEFAEALAIEQGVPASQIRTIDNARDTVEEIELAVELLAEERTAASSRLVVVSSATHLARAEKIVMSHNITYSMAPTNYLAYDKAWYRFDAGTLHSADRALHEYVGMIWFWIRS